MLEDIACLSYLRHFSNFAIPAVAECNAIQAFLNKVKRWSITSDDRDIDDILDGTDYGLFKKMQFFKGCLHHILPNERRCLHGMKRRKSGHNYNLPILKTS